MNHLNTNAQAPSARALAYQALYDILEKGAYSNLRLQTALKKNHLKGPEAHLLTELVYGTLRKYNYLVWIISRLSSHPVKKIHPAVRILLCIGLYQLIYLSRIPESAAVNETVKIAKKITHPGNVRFINGVLRNFLRKKEQFELPKRESNPLLYDELFYNMPGWLVQKWQKELGPEKTDLILKAFNEVPDTSIRVNTLRTDTQSVLKLLSEKGVEAQQSDFYSPAIILKHGADQFFAEILNKGYASVQSVSSMIPPVVLSPEPGERVLDMCAAPGSKTTEMAELMNNEGHIDAWDLYDHRVQLIKESAHKLGINIIHAEVQDSTVLNDSCNEEYDKVLLDAPCSGLGVLGHKLEIRWNRKEADIKEFPILQKKLISTAAHYVKHGGVLVYSTCTLNKQENESVVKWFIDNFTDFELEGFQLPNGKEYENGMATLWPDECHSDGFFIAKMKRR